MFEKVNPSHPDKVADRIAGAIVDYAYTIEENPKIAIEVMIGHKVCKIMCESNLVIPMDVIMDIINRVTNGGDYYVEYLDTLQDEHLANNQSNGIKCGDNGIFRGVPITNEQEELTSIVKSIYEDTPFDGKFIKDGDRLIICQSHIDSNVLRAKYPNAIINPLGDWNGGTDVDTGCTNRKLGSDMGDGVTGGGLHGKDLSKADVSVNIYAHIMAQKTHQNQEFVCAIGDDNINGIPYKDVVEIAREYINSIGGFEKFAEWGLIR